MALIPIVTFPLSSTPADVYTNLWVGIASTTQPSDTAAFDTGLDGRDHGVCVVCGFSEEVHHSHIIPKAEPKTVSNSSYS